MRSSVQSLVTLVAAFASLAAALPAAAGTTKSLGVNIANVGATDIIPNKYIVVYNSTFSSAAIDTYEAAVSSTIQKRNVYARHISGKRSLSTSIKSIDMGAWRCASLEADDATINEIAASNEVAYVEADTIVKASKLVVQSDAPAGLVRISHAAVGGQGYVFDDTAGAGVTVYVVDTGIRTTHSEFSGRATFGANAIDNSDTDGNGHGSHVAGTIAGTNFGVAKSANVVAVKVLGADGSGDNSAVLSGLQFVRTDAQGKKAVMNMSLGGSFSQALNAAIAQMTADGVVAVVAAGNENQDTANTSPGSAASAITVGATDNRDAKASFSNFGPAVDIFAPGVNVLSVGIASDTATNVLSGTSMSSPHVAGMAAYLMGMFPELTTPAAVKAKMVEFAGLTGAAVTGLTARNGNTTTLIAYNGSGQ